MRFIRQIITLILTVTVFSIGTGADVVHICSHYCKNKICTDKAHSHNDNCCCKNDLSSQNGETCISSKCTCIDVICDIDYYNVTQEDDSDINLFATVCLHSFFSLIPVNECTELIYCNAPNAPPAIKNGRTLLTMHSTLII